MATPACCLAESKAGSASIGHRRGALTLTDGELDGLLSFEWTRLYRTSTAEIDRGLGWGWRHGLAYRLELHGDDCRELIIGYPHHNAGHSRSGWQMFAEV